MTNVQRPDTPIFISEEDVGACVSLNEAIDALKEGLILEARSEAWNVDKALATWGNGSSMHALGSMMPVRGYVGFKTWANTPKGATAVFSLFSAENGALLAMIEAGLLGKLRTSGISGLATGILAAEGADEVALIGTGVQAMMQIAAIAAMRKINRLRVFSPNAEKRGVFVARASDHFAFRVENSETLEDALAGAPIVTLITRAQEPFLDTALVARGAHVNAAGAILPGNAEFRDDLFDRAGLIVVDSVPNARKASREFREHFGTELQGWEQVRTLGEVIQEKIGRPADADLTLFKPMGMGLSDLAVAAVAYERAVERTIGKPLPTSKMPEPRWTAVS